MKNLIFLLGFLALLLVFGIFYSASSTPVPTKQAEGETFQTKTDSQGEVDFEATPKNIQGDVFEFEVVMDTHSVVLDQDMVAVSKLIGDREIEYKPILWKGDGPGGHHRKGILRFERIVPKPSSIRLMIFDVGSAERSFAWDL